MCRECNDIKGFMRALAETLTIPSSLNNYQRLFVPEGECFRWAKGCIAIEAVESEDEP